MNKPRHSSSSAPALARNKGPRPVAAQMKKPAAPAVYRPQTPTVLQSKKSSGSTPAETRQLPSAPPVYRPQTVAHCLQKKSAPAQRNASQTAKPTPPVAPRNCAKPPCASHGVQRKPARPVATNAAQLKGTVQRFAWAIHDSRDMKKSAVVDENLRKASQRYTHTQTTSDPEKVDTPDRPFLNPGETIHLHAHGNVDGLSGFGADSLAREVSRKFDLEDLPGRVIVLHSCNTGQKEYGKEVLEELVSLASYERISLTGTTIYAPVNFLVVENDGLSYVAKSGVDDSALREEQRSESLQRLGEGWRGWRVTMNGAVEEINNPGGGVVGVLNAREAAKAVKFKPPKVKQQVRQTEYGYYDDPRRRLTQFEENLIHRALVDRQYPPKSRHKKETK